MAVADSWEHTWRSGMIVGSTADDVGKAEPVLALRMRIGLLLVVGAVVAGVLTASVRLQVLRAEQRRLTQQIADVGATTELVRCQVARQSAPGAIAAYAETGSLQAPVNIAEVGPPTVARSDADPGSNGLRSDAQRLLRKLHHTAHRLGTLLRGPTTGP